MKKHKYIYIIGRLPDEENAHYGYKDMTCAEAMIRFAKDLREEDPEEYDYRFKECDGCPVIYEGVIASESPMESLA
jgi:hypothetical protein